MKTALDHKTFKAESLHSVSRDPFGNSFHYYSWIVQFRSEAKEAFLSLNIGDRENPNYQRRTSLVMSDDQTTGRAFMLLVPAGKDLDAHERLFLETRLARLEIDGSDNSIDFDFS
ncbi:MAG: hypothetical protein HQ519_18580 [Planctomycetes bacterium]|nr:hypothetical protein [Planctomycetota bacterium]